MQEKSDAQLLCDYAERGNEAAFREIVTRHTNFVYSAAVRQVESSAVASDLAQNVFADLARKARQLAEKFTGDSSLAGWLHRSTRYAALNHLRDSRRRRENERLAMEQLLANSEPAADWEQIRPALDEALDSLGDEDREALLLRYFKNQDYRAVGLALGVSDDAAQKRVSRAVERLREFFSKRNVTIGTSGLAAVITANAVQAAPVGLAVTISAAALAKVAATASTVITATTKTVTSTVLQKTLVTATVAVLAGAGIYEAHQAAQLRENNQSLRQQMNQLLAENARLASGRPAPMPSLPAPPIQAATTAATNMLLADSSEPTNFWASLNGKETRLTREQAESFLQANGRNAANLLAAYRTSHDSALLEEAMKKFPNDPQVAFEAAEATTLHSLALTPEEQRQWLDAFKQSAPNNSLANYLSAINCFNAGQIDEGVKELSAASGKALDDYTVGRAENDIEVYLAAGYSPAEAEQFGTSQLLLPQLAQLKQLTQQISQLASAYRQAGDDTSADVVLLMADNLGQQYATPSPGEPTVSQLVGIAMERIALSALDPDTPYGDSGQTVQDRLHQLMQQQTQVQQMSQQVEDLLPSLTPQDLIIYKNRWLMFGEENAQQWLISKYGQK